MDNQPEFFPKAPKGINQWDQKSSLPPAHRVYGWDTERKAAKRPREGQRLRVYETLRDGPEGGMTDFEISEELGILRGTVAKRRQELCHLGFVEPTDVRRRTDNNVPAIVWRLKAL